MRTQNHAPRLVLAERIGVDYREMGRLIFDSEESRRAQLGEIPARSFWAAMAYSLLTMNSWANSSGATLSIRNWYRA